MNDKTDNQMDKQGFFYDDGYLYCALCNSNIKNKNDFRQHVRTLKHVLNVYYTDEYKTDYALFLEIMKGHKYEKQLNKIITTAQRLNMCPVDVYNNYMNYIKRYNSPIFYIYEEDQPPFITL